MTNVIEVPYMPIDEFKTADKLLEEIDEQDDGEKPFFEFQNTEELSKDMRLILHGMGMEKYIKLFSNRKVQLDTFLKLNETDLKELGITDENDISKIVKKLGNEKKTNDSEFIVRENHVEDLKIIRNVHQHLILLQNYCAYVELQMKKNKLTDYRIESKECASLYLKAFTEAALLQCQIMSKKIYDENSDCGLIDKVLKKHNLMLPPVYQKILPKKKRKGTPIIKKVITVLGVSSLIIIIGKLLVASKRY